MPTTTPGHPIDQRTAQLSMPLPHIDNYHEDDVPRLRTAIEMIDAAVHSAQTQLADIDSVHATALANKVDKVAGKGLSTEDYSSADKGKVAALGTAATANVTTAKLDTTPGMVLKVGDFGLGEYTPVMTKSQENTLLNGRSSFYSAQDESDLLTYSGALQIGYAAPGYATQIASNMGISVPILKVRVLNNNVWGLPVTLLHTNNLAQGVGSSIEYPMSQAATTTALNNHTHSEFNKLHRLGGVTVLGSGGGTKTMDLSVGGTFSCTVNANTTFAFSNIPANTDCEISLEIALTSGTITLPADCYWSNGVAPTFTTGKRHALFFKRCSLGASGWYVSALAGFVA